MARSASDGLIEALRAIVTARGLKVLRTIVEGARTRRLVLELCRREEIWLESGFGLHVLKDRRLSVTYTIWVRWPRAETMLRDARPPSPYGESAMIPQVLEARSMLYPIAGLTLGGDPAYFARDEASFAPSQFDLIPELFSQVVNILVDRVVPEFCGYCDPHELARAATQPEAKSRLLMSHITVAAILAAAGKAQEFETWRQACRHGLVAPRQRRPDVQERDELYMNALARFLPSG